ncbi:MAG: energy-dependent translational throttle protein EttA [Muribaculaceae bacterium]|nr:energy-dependent translational throttle protein EttA [Muribaculaceae bacterium]MDE6361039.1 energy-dependent translational throttle protein EttA [Muribaculaceae bacterium]
MAAPNPDDKKIIFSMVGVSKTYPPQKQVLKNIYLSFFYGAKIGIIGLNGSGKSSLLKIIAGIDKEYQGEVVFSPGYSVGYLEQEPKLDPEKTVIEVVREGVQPVMDLLREFDEVNAAFADPDVLEDPDKMDKLIQRQGELQDALDACDAWNIDSKLERAMDALQCPPDDQKVDTLSGGERRRVALCRLLLQQPDVLLLDEPTNHLDAESIDWLEQHLQQYPGTVIAITHDRYFLDHVAGWILELDRGEGIPWKGNYSSWLDQKTKRMAQEEKQASKRRKTLERELEWVRMAPKARQAKGKARLSSYDRLLNQDQKEREEKLEIFIPNGPRLGNKVIEAKGLEKSFGKKLLFKDLEFALPPNGIVGVIGPNGAGKTTLFRLIMDQEKPDAGSFEVGETVKVAYVDQRHHDLVPDHTVYQVISQGVESFRMGGRDVNARAYLSKFNFAGADQEKKIGVLSGGERNRLHLAMALKEEGNVLLLDEPTNDIDVNTLRALEEGLENFAGCAVVVSHDRWFLDRICTHILSFEGDGKVVYYQGSYSDYEEYKKAQNGGKELPRRRYRKLMND